MLNNVSKDAAQFLCMCLPYTGLFDFLPHWSQVQGSAGSNHVDLWASTFFSSALSQ